MGVFGEIPVSFSTLIVSPLVTRDTWTVPASSWASISFKILRVPVRICREGKVENVVTRLGPCTIILAGAHNNRHYHSIVFYQVTF